MELSYGVAVLQPAGSLTVTHVAGVILSPSLRPPSNCPAGCALPRGALFAVGNSVVGNEAAEYREHAKECLKLALGARTEQERHQLNEMAAAWERMSTDRERQISRDPQ